MAIPDFQTMMRPILEFLSDGQVHTNAECRQAVAEKFGLSKEEQMKLLPSGRQPILTNRISWAIVHMSRAELIERPGRGQSQISQRGGELLSTHAGKVTMKTLFQFSEYAEFRRKKRPEDTESLHSDVSSEETPEETLESAYQQLRKELALELVDTVKKCPPGFFERLVVELLVNMGYGGSMKDAGMALGRSGDEGIDGIIKEDRLGLDVIYLQAKRWEGTVGRPEIQRFVGALHGKHARKGVFLTTGEFAQTARDYVQGLDSKVVLIGGAELGELMIDFNIGVSLRAAYQVKRLDSDYFADE